MSGGGGGSTTSYSTNLPKYAKPYYEELLKQTGKSIFNTVTKDMVGQINPTTGKPYTAKDIGAVTGIQPYEKYEGEKVAGFTPLQEQMQAEVAGLQTPEQFAAATSGAQRGADLGYATAEQGINRAMAYRPGSFNAGYRAQSYSPNAFSAMMTGIGGLQQYQMQGPGDIGAERASSEYFTPGAASYYMSPYQQQVSDITAREMQRRADQASASRTMEAIKGGTFGGSRQALLQAEADRNTQQAIGDVYARGQQSAYESAQRQFEADQARRMSAQQLNVQSGLQAALANQQAGLTTGQQNLAALLGVQQLGTTEGLRAQLANQQAALEAQRMGEQSKQFGATFGETSAARAAQYALAEQQAREQAAQYSAGLGKDLGLAGLQSGLTGSQLLGQLGTAEQQANLARLQAQSSAGAQQQNLAQQNLDWQYQQAMEERDWQRSLLEYYSNILRGNASALGSSQVQYVQQPSAQQQLAGLSMAGLGSLMR